METKTCKVLLLKITTTCRWIVKTAINKAKHKLTPKIEQTLKTVMLLFILNYKPHLKTYLYGAVYLW